jgi:hypothetical protein
MLNKGDRLPQFETTTVDDVRVSYRELWQKKNLALVCLPEDSSPEASAYVASLRESIPVLAARDAVCVVTTGAIEGVPSPGVLVADRWGEVQWVSAAARPADLPPPDQIAAWLGFVQIQCPECEGEVH